MKKLLLSLGLFGMFLLASGSVEAAGATRGAKQTVALNYTTTASSVSVSGASVVYAVIMSTGASGDFMALFDSASIGALSATSITSALKTRVYMSSATQNTVINFDPPLQFANGIIAANSTATAQGIIVYERGRLVNGY